LLNNRQAVTNLFFAAVHFLLLQGMDHPLRLFHPNFESDGRPNVDPYPEFRSFCLTERPRIEHILRSRLTQTNEVRRCLYLALGFALIARESGPLAIY
jgi:hypothetical protein